MVHEKLRHKCPLCDRTFMNKYSISPHIKNDHANCEKNILCHHCEKTFVHESQLTVHIKRNHEQSESFKCTKCGKGFFKKRDFEQHFVGHTNEEDVVCETCGKLFRRKTTFSLHKCI